MEKNNKYIVLYVYIGNRICTEENQLLTRN